MGSFSEVPRREKKKSDVLHSEGVRYIPIWVKTGDHSADFKIRGDLWRCPRLNVPSHNLWQRSIPLPHRLWRTMSTLGSTAYLSSVVKSWRLTAHSYTSTSTHDPQPTTASIHGTTTSSSTPVSVVHGTHEFLYEWEDVISKLDLTSNLTYLPSYFPLFSSVTGRSCEIRCP